MTGFDDIEYACLTDVGLRRSHNQDSHASLPATDLDQWRQRGHVFMVADGMGAHAVGELASKLAAEGVPHIYSKHAKEGPAPSLRKAFIEANSNIHNRGQANPEFAGMGTTGTALVLRSEGAWVGHVGDSRAYRVRQGRIEQLSFDHSLVWELARRQRKKPEELSGIPSNVIVRSLGPEPLVQVDVEGPHPLQAGDAFLLCSDGLSGPLEDKDIGAIISTLPAQEAVKLLIHLANLQGGPDNITAIVVKIRGTPPTSASPVEEEPEESSEDDGRTLKPWRFWPLWSLFLGIFLALVAIYLAANDYPGRIPAFLGGAAFLVAGLAGLLVQSHRETQAEDEEPRQKKLKVYRKVPCSPDAVLVEKLYATAVSLEKRAREHGLPVDWQQFDAGLDKGKKSAERQDWKGAFAIHCRNLSTILDVVAEKRGREEAFKPHWDKPVA